MNIQHQIMCPTSEGLSHNCSPLTHLHRCLLRLNQVFMLNALFGRASLGNEDTETSCPGQTPPPLCKKQQKSCGTAAGPDLKNLGAMQHCLPLAGSPCGHMHATWLRHGQHNLAWRRTGRACKIAGAASVPPPQEPNLPGDNTSPSSRQEHSSAQDSGGGIGARVKRFFLGAGCWRLPLCFLQTMPLNALVFLPHLPHNVTKWSMQVTRWTRTAWQSWVWGQWPAMVSCVPHNTCMALQQAAGFDVLHESAAVFSPSSQVNAFYLQVLFPISHMALDCPCLGLPLCTS